MYPVLIYDDHCYLCTMFARLADKVLSGRITILGHYSQGGIEFKKNHFPDMYDGLEMSWFVTADAAYGGSRGLQKLVRYVFARKENGYIKNDFDLHACTSGCRSPKSAMSRLLSLLRNGKVIRIKGTA